jgi:hypothetical protein
MSRYARLSPHPSGDGPPPRQADGEGTAGIEEIKGKGPFQPHLVDPAVAEAVLIQEVFAAVKPEVAEPDSYAMVGHPRGAVLPAVDEEAVQVQVLPAEGHLKHAVELRQDGVIPHEESPPDERADAAEHHPELVEARGCRGREHGRPW